MTTISVSSPEMVNNNSIPEITAVKKINTKSLFEFINANIEELEELIKVLNSIIKEKKEKLEELTDDEKEILTRNNVRGGVFYFNYYHWIDSLESLK